MDHVKIYHNPYCGSSVTAVMIADELGAPAEIVVYQKTPPGPGRRWHAHGGASWRIHRSPTWCASDSLSGKKLGLAEADAAGRPRPRWST